MYSVARLALVLWLVHPSTQGSAYLYEQYIWPALSQANPDPSSRGAAGAAGPAATLHKDCAPTVQRATAFLAVRRRGGSQSGAETAAPSDCVAGFFAPVCSNTERQCECGDIRSADVYTCVPALPQNYGEGVRQRG